MPLISTRGAASAQGFGEFAQSAAPVYIEDVFSTYLIKPAADFTTYSINNGIDLLGEGGMTWFKARDAAQNNLVYDTVRGSSSGNANALITNGTQAQQTTFFDFVTPNANGFTVNFASGGGQLTNSGINYASWTFRKQPKFFDVVTFTAPALSTELTVNHNLGAVPGCVIMKSSTNNANWIVIHRYDQTKVGELNTTATFQDASFNASFTSTSFKVKGGFNISANSGTYVAYIFAHNAGGFGLSGSDNVISCGSYTGTGAAGNAITTGHEPQYLLIKNTSSAASWFIYDVMRGLSVGGPSVAILANTSDAEGGTATNVKPTATGFVVDSTSGGLNASGNTYIYIAIRRGPMKVPTSGTSVLGLSARSGTGANATVSGGQIADAALIKNRGSAVGDLFAARLTGTGYLETSSTAAEVAAGTTILQANPWDVMDGVKVGTTSTITNASSNTFINYLFRRAPGFMDVVCYTGTGSNRTVAHNLGVVPELIFVKGRSQAGTYWVVRNASLASGNILYLSLDYASTENSNVFTTTAPTASVFSVGTNDSSNASGQTLVAYLFATVAGVSKVGSYTGSGTTKQIDCGFTGGARFVLIKRTDSTGDWYVWDSARGIVAGNDPYLLLNSTAAEVTNTDYVDTYSAGFELSSTAPAALNANGGSFIFLAIA